MSSTRREVLPDADAVATRAAELMVAALAAVDGQARVSLAGGSTPKKLYALLASPAYRDRIDWDRIHWFWGDERFVPLDDPDSNYLMVKTAMFDHVPVPQANIHPVRTVGLTPEQSAADYADELRKVYGGDRLDAGRPLFDVSLLGLGEDGHTASLFPGVDALNETRAWARESVSPAGQPRITLSYPALDSARCTMFLVCGASKRPALARMGEVPAGKLAPVGETYWLLDREAAG